MKIEIQGCRWFQKTGRGNTYHAVKCFVDGKLVYTSKDYEPGYEKQYIESGLRELVKLKILPMREGESFSYSELEKNYGLECSVIDVNRKKDLKAWMNEPND